VRVTGDLDRSMRRPSTRWKELETLREALNSGDYECIRSLGHNLKGTGTGYGFPALSAIGKELEQDALRQDAPSTSRHLWNTTTYLKRNDVVYEA
jgi:histidine phosphotransfer protein HptB